MKTKTFINRARKHYREKYAEEAERWGIKAISDGWVDFGDPLMTADVFRHLAKQLGCKCSVGSDDPQQVFVIFSTTRIPRPAQVHSLWSILEDLTDRKSSMGDRIEALDSYDGPYRLEVPEKFEDEN